MVLLEDAAALQQAICIAPVNLWSDTLRILKGNQNSHHRFEQGISKKITFVQIHVKQGEESREKGHSSKPERNPWVNKVGKEKSNASRKEWTVNWWVNGAFGNNSGSSSQEQQAWRAPSLVVFYGFMGQDANKEDTQTFLKVSGAEIEVSRIRQNEFSNWRE